VRRRHQIPMGPPAPAGAGLFARAARPGRQRVHPFASDGWRLGRGSTRLRLRFTPTSRSWSNLVETIFLDHLPPRAAPRHLPNRGRFHRRHRPVHRRTVERPLPVVHSDPRLRHCHCKGHRLAPPQGANCIRYKGPAKAANEDEAEVSAWKPGLLRRVRRDASPGITVSFVGD